MDAPIRFCETQTIAPGTHVVRQLYGEGVNPFAIHVNSMVITGAEPMIVDCGPAVTRAGWLDHAFELVDPADVRWVYLSHDDSDHTGNLREVLDRCPRATLVTNWTSVERIGADYLLPLDRMRWVNDGESFTANGRRFVAVVPPTFDSPATRGLFDTATGVYWAADSFATPVTHEVDDVADLDPDFAREAFLQAQVGMSPWVRWVDEARYGAHLDRVRSLGASVVASAHAVTLHGDQVDTAFGWLHALRDVVPLPTPDQSVLDAMVAMLEAAAAA
jgi:flavorubredoxin